MASLKKSLLILSAIGSIAVVLLALFLIAGGEKRSEIWISSMAAIVSIMALGNAVLVFTIAEQRSGFTNAFAIARRWDEEPVLGARNILRPHLSDLNKLALEVHDSNELQIAIIHLVNFYWDMASAVETGWTQEGYLRLRFKTSLETITPAMTTLAKVTHDRGITEALNSIGRLRSLWATRPSS